MSISPPPTFIRGVKFRITTMSVTGSTEINASFILLNNNRFIFHQFRFAKAKKYFLFIITYKYEVFYLFRRKNTSFFKRKAQKK